LSSCGGVVGSIEKYPFPNVNPDSLKSALNNVYYKHPELIISDTTMYGKNNEEDFYYVLYKMGFLEKRKYRKLFEENILPKIKEELLRK